MIVLSWLFCTCALDPLNELEETQTVSFTDEARLHNGND
jgi:hypothetical protein